MNIFFSAPEFIELDNRQDRKVNQVTAESTYNRLSAQLPDWYVKGNTVLDLGSCLGAAGHMALTNGATHYTGVEYQQKYVDDSKKIFEKYWPGHYDIVQANLEEFLDDCIANGKKYDIVVASGVLYTFLNIFTILEKIAAVASKSVLIDTMFASDPGLKRGAIIIREDIPMVYANGPKTYAGIGSTCSITALDIILKTCGFHRDEDVIIPPVTVGSHDGYSDILQSGKLQAPARYAARFNRKEQTVRKLIDIVLDDKESDAVEFYQVPNVVESAAATKVWTFDDSVANRFQQEARDHIPDYARVVEMCIEVASDNLSKDDAIIDVGSALGYTVDKFMQAGFSNVYGLDNSESMVKQSLHKDRIMLGNDFPSMPFKMIVMNWTLHFVIDKLAYIKKMYDNLEPGGYLIISDKTSQSLEVKKKYYDFKRANGVSQEYIDEKEKKLAGYMYTVPTSWYNATFADVGFSSVEVINARYGFVTFMCKK